MKTCPYCAEEIQDAAVKCKHCKSDLEKQSNKPTYQANEEGVMAGNPAFRSYLWMFLLLWIIGFGNNSGGNYTFGTVCFAVWTPVLAIFVFLHRFSRSYTITKSRVQVHKGIIAHRVDEIEISHIRAMFLNQSIFGRIFNYGDVILPTSGANTSGYDVRITRVANPGEYLATIKGLQNKMAV